MHDGTGGSVTGVATLVLGPAQKHVDTNGEQRQDVGAQDGAEAEWVQGRLSGLEELRRNDVGDAVGDEHHGVDGDFLGVALLRRRSENAFLKMQGNWQSTSAILLRIKTYCSVGTDKTQRDNVWTQVEKRHVQGGQTAVVGRGRQRVQEDGSDETDDDAEHDESSAEVVLRHVPDGEENAAVAYVAGGGLYDAVGDGQEGRALRRVAQSFDDQRREVGETTVGNADPDVEEEHEPDTDVKESLDALLLLECFVFDT